jgi:hypothetical protein
MMGICDQLTDADSHAYAMPGRVPYSLFPYSDETETVDDACDLFEVVLPTNHDDRLSGDSHP